MYLRFAKLYLCNELKNYIIYNIWKQLFQIPANIVFGHNKFHKLKELLEHHFNNNDRKDTRAIVFIEVCILAFQTVSSIYKTHAIHLKLSEIIIIVEKYI